MRKSTKVTVTLACIFLCLGIILTIVGGVTGARNYSFSHILNMVNAKDFDYSDMSADEFDSKGFVLKESFDTNDVQDINIELEISALKIKKSKDDKCHLYVEEGKEDNLIANLDYKTLTIYDEHETVFWNRVQSTYAILELPEKLFGSVNVNAELGYICLEDMCKANEMAFDVEVGNVEISEIEAENLYLNCELGNISVQKIVAESLEMECGMGNIDAIYIEAEDTNMKCDMGNITTVFAGNSGEYDIEEDSDLGDVVIDESPNDNDEICNKSIEVNCDMGNVEISFLENANNEKGENSGETDNDVTKSEELKEENDNIKELGDSI